MFGTQSLFGIRKKNKAADKNNNSATVNSIPVPNEAPVNKTSENFNIPESKTRRKTMISSKKPEISSDLSDITPPSKINQDPPKDTNQPQSNTLNSSGSLDSSTQVRDRSKRPAPRTPISVFEDSDSDSESQVEVYTIRRAPQESLDQLMFSPTSLIPLASAIQMKFDINFSEGFPSLIDASLQANSSRYTQAIEASEQTMLEIEQTTAESQKLCDELANKSIDIENKAIVTLDTMKKTHSNLNSLIDARMSISVYFILFMYWLFRSILHVLQYVGGFVSGIFKTNISGDKEQKSQK